MNIICHLLGGTAAINFIEIEGFSDEQISTREDVEAMSSGRVDREYEINTLQYVNQDTIQKLTTDQVGDVTNSNSGLHD